MTFELDNNKFIVTDGGEAIKIRSIVSFGLCPADEDSPRRIKIWLDGMQSGKDHNYPYIITEDNDSFEDFLSEVDDRFRNLLKRYDDISREVSDRSLDRDGAFDELGARVKELFSED